MQPDFRRRAGKALASDPVLRRLVDGLVHALHPEAIYLFGSRAREDGDADSDYDLMVIVAASDQPVHVRSRSVRPLLWEVPVPVDVLVWTREEFERRLPVVASLPATIRREGRLIYVARAA
ncbi:MAG: nucleotidyltransferase domain-containing protein [Deltaproteobacteria bacterium]|nr:nucleotidyltransferase domain-containing protein [Deltaproteobacteria bacterium]